MATGHPCFISKILYNQVLNLGKFMDIQEAINLYIEYLIVEKGLSENTISAYKDDLNFFELVTLSTF